jgi:hypothetical protein
MKTNWATKTGLGLGAEVGMAGILKSGMIFRNTYRFECRDRFGKLKWVEEIENLVTTEGLNDALTQYFKGSGYTASWFVGLYGGTGTLDAADTMTSHAGWTEITAYSNSFRPTLTLGTAAAGSISNTASKAVFTMNGAYTVKGGFVVFEHTIGGSTGPLYGEAAFGTPRAGDTGDTITVTVTLTAASA